MSEGETNPVSVQEPRAKRKTRHLPKWKVLLLNDPVNDFAKVVEIVHQLTPLTLEESVKITTEAHKEGVSLLLTTHKERAELYQEQFESQMPPIKVEIEPDE
jgi:ATP-dependent Clp protease adapter protein ClpS